MSKTMLRGTLLAALAALGTAGCGGSSKPALTKAQFVARANAICAEGNKKLDTAGAALGNNPSNKQIMSFATGTFIPYIQGQIDHVRALGAPAGEEATFTHMMDVAQEDLDKVKANPALAANPGSFASFASLAHPYGLTDCASQS